METVKGLLEQVRKGLAIEDEKQISEIRELVLTRSLYGSRSTEYLKEIRPNVLSFLIDDHFKVRVANGYLNILWKEDHDIKGFSLYDTAMFNIKTYERKKAIEKIRTEVIEKGKSSVEFKKIDIDLKNELVEEGFHFIPTPDGGGVLNI